MPGQLSFLKIGNDFVRDPGVNVLILVHVARSLSKAALTQLWTRERGASRWAAATVWTATTTMHLGETMLIWVALRKRL